MARLVRSPCNHREDHQDAPLDNTQTHSEPTTTLQLKGTTDAVFCDTAGARARAQLNEKMPCETGTVQMVSSRHADQSNQNMTCSRLRRLFVGYEIIAKLLSPTALFVSQTLPQSGQPAMALVSTGTKASAGRFSNPTAAIQANGISSPVVAVSAHNFK